METSHLPPRSRTRAGFASHPRALRLAGLSVACGLATAFLALGPLLEAAAAPPSVPRSIEGEDFDAGGEGLGFHQIGGGCANRYRPSEPVCLEATPGGWALTLKPGEWGAYTVEVERSGYYDFELQCVAPPAMPVSMPHRLELTDASEGEVLAEVLWASEFGAEDSMRLQTAASYLSSGPHVLRVANTGPFETIWSLDRIMVREGLPPFRAFPLAGQDEPGFADGARDEARFDRIVAIDADDAGNLYIADAGNHRVRKARTDGAVATLAGTGEAVSRDGPGAQAAFRNLLDLGADGLGNCYVRDEDDLRRISADGQVATLASLRIPTGEVSYTNSVCYEDPLGGLICAETTQVADADYAISDLAVRRSGQVVLVGSMRVSTFKEAPGYWPKKGYSTVVTRTRLIVNRDRGWEAGEGAEVGLYDVWSSSPTPAYLRGTKLLSLAKGSADRLLVAAETHAVVWIEGCCEVPVVARQLLIGTPTHLSYFATAPSVPAALAELDAGRTLLHADGRFHLLQSNRNPLEIPAEVPPRIGLVAHHHGVVYAAATNRVWRYLPAWPFALTLESPPLAPEASTLRLTGPAGLEVRLESSRELRSWQPVATLLTTGDDTFRVMLDQAALWYRAVWNP